MLLSFSLTSILASIVLLVFIMRRLWVQASQTRRDAEAEKPLHLDLTTSLSEPARQLKELLVKVLSASVISPEDGAAFKQSANSYWAQQQCEVAPACFVRPRNVQELAQAIKILKTEFDNRKSGSTDSDGKADGLFAVRGGGHSPVDGAASIKGGVVIDMSLFNQVVVSGDQTSVVIGAGCKWLHVSQALEEKGLAVAGGRNSAVGVGGLTLGGGLSFFSPRFGFVCSNIIEYELVLADGNVTTASETTNPDLWRALKGGSNNFGIVTRFTARAFPSTNIWGGFLYMPSFQASKVLSAFHDFTNRAITNDEGKTHDEYAAGPIACFTYLQQLGIQAIAVNLVHTKSPADDKKWPACWKSSQFSSLWRFWSTCKVRSLTSATDEMNALNPPGRRQTWATTTIKNDRITLEAAHKAYRDGIVSIRKANIKGMSWTFVVQPLLPDWARKGDSNPLGLDTSSDEPLVIVNFTVNWALSKDDENAEKITRAAIHQIDAFANDHGTGHRYKYLNYCGGAQRPFDGYGKDNLQFLKEVSRKYDSEGFFQGACNGGFKLDR
ncbi:FAD-binding domain-containing protein [Lophium mytilinum]|uniref:FAD-binding domain-containing protein n=1 Tax=Lophium mytilinum TaxID=390894 RepID=A0A6A6R2V2_9PEZI|nr:FAD-binding domain-containing protein [Lophium mytilinum]